MILASFSSAEDALPSDVKKLYTFWRQSSEDQLFLFLGTPGIIISCGFLIIRNTPLSQSFYPYIPIPHVSPSEATPETIAGSLVSSTHGKNKRKKQRERMREREGEGGTERRNERGMVIKQREGWIDG